MEILMIGVAPASNRFTSGYALARRRLLSCCALGALSKMIARRRWPRYYHDALTGHAGGGVGRTYGSVPVAVRARAIAEVTYPGLELSILYWAERPVRTRQRAISRQC